MPSLCTASRQLSTMVEYAHTYYSEGNQVNNPLDSNYLVRRLLPILGSCLLHAAHHVERKLRSHYTCSFSDQVALWLMGIE